MENNKYSIELDPSINQARKRRGTPVQIIDFCLNSQFINLGSGKTYMVKTYGCQGNLADGETIMGILEAMGFVETTEETKADVVIFNTCAIRENAEDRVFGEIGRFEKFKRKHPNMIIGVCGCMSQEEKVVNKIKTTYPQVDLIFGTHNIASLPTLLNDVIKNHLKVVEVLSVEGDIYEGVPMKRLNESKAWVDIMYGCDEFCTYCIVPYTRGKERSRKPEAIIKEVDQLIQLGYKEVTLLGQNVNAYGKDFSDCNYTFGNLLMDLHKLPIERIRFTTSHPRDLDELTMQAMALGGNIMPHLHLPVQSGNDEVLHRMNRKYTRGEYLSKINRLKELVPGISITTDIIVAFPGETEKQFEDTISLVKDVEFEGAYTFIYSPREGTPASKYENSLTEEEKHIRLNKLNDVVNEYSLKGELRFENKLVKVLVEGPSKNNKDMMCGYTEHEKLVNFKGDKSLIGKIVTVKISKAYSWHLFGEIVDN